MLLVPPEAISEGNLGDLLSPALVRNAIFHSNFSISRWILTDLNTMDTGFPYYDRTRLFLFDTMVLANADSFDGKIGVVVNCYDSNLLETVSESYVFCRMCLTEYTYNIR